MSEANEKKTGADNATPAMPGAKAAPENSSASITLPSAAGAAPTQVSLAKALAAAQQHHAKREFEDAKIIYQLILDTQPDHADAMFYIGAAMHQAGDSAQGVEQMKRAAQLNPRSVAYNYNLGLVYEAIGDMPAAIACYRQVIANDRGGQWHCTLAKQLTDAGQLDDAIEFAREALTLLAPHARGIAHNQLANALTLKGELTEAIANFQIAISLEVENAMMNSNYVFTLNYVGQPDLTAIFQEHKKFGDKFESFVPRMYVNPLQAKAGASAFTNSKRRLRIGYVSPDFNDHAVGKFIEPVLATHDTNKFELFCYYNKSRVDDATKRMQSAVANWRMTADMSDDELARMIQADAIDILVDLSGHTGLNRLLVFARKPAPVQATWIGYPNTTGLSTMDYRITDAFADPIGATEALHTEKLVRMPECFSCFKPPSNAPHVSALPAVSRGTITFGSFNNFAKITPEVMRVWIAILARVPGSRLVLKNWCLDNDRMKTFMLEAFARCGATTGQVELWNPNTSNVDHLNCYNSIDIGLDPFPYNGTTTTCDALWMGVPVITLAGVSHVGRVGVSQMSNLGLQELIARDTDHYVDIAVALANDVPRLAALRGAMRARMSASPLMDAPRLTKNLEAAYDNMWSVYLSAQKP
jgi:predicted O-linked N-acetylglucosamine transferase (SPINDLY family)